MSFSKLLRTGWFRLWVLSVFALFAAFTAVASYVLLQKEACYRFVTISTAEKVPTDDAPLVAHLREEVASKTYCGSTQYSILLTLEQLAKAGTVIQVGFQWQEPRGWSFNDFDMLDFVEPKDIRASYIPMQVRKYVQKARLQSLVPWLIATVSFSIGVLLLGLGIAWVRHGFARQGKSHATTDA